MPEKGRKKLRGQPELYDEVKGQVNLSLTATGVKGLDELAKQMGLSRSEFIEQVGRGLLPVLSPDELTALRRILTQLKADNSDEDLVACLAALSRLME
ncbi:ribbon-helix-helix protein, CopG family [Acaryochloris sp. IP29b_bin.137]|uniref:ribbon-helix-helix protein, CopG family n=1 Tax=Acaryochloris sp. IP29b_bin.137 TaxID=2969217 RepID=UPI00263667CE|nr:ribbon-helix-helix protein, CopG family [Acaryochloris sp. IP29b_bin.137]